MSSILVLSLSAPIAFADTGVRAAAEAGAKEAAKIAPKLAKELGPIADRLGLKEAAAALSAIGAGTVAKELAELSPAALAGLQRVLSEASTDASLATYNLADLSAAVEKARSASSTTPSATKVEKDYLSARRATGTRASLMQALSEEEEGVLLSNNRLAGMAIEGGPVVPEGGFLKCKKEVSPAAVRNFETIANKAASTVIEQAGGREVVEAGNAKGAISDDEAGEIYQKAYMSVVNQGHAGFCTIMDQCGYLRKLGSICKN